MITKKELQQIIKERSETSGQYELIDKLVDSYTEMQLQLKRQIILAYMIEKYATMSKSKPVAYYAKGWRESAVFILTGEILDEWRLDVANAERMVDMKKAFEAIDESIENGLSLIHEIAKP